MSSPPSPTTSIKAGPLHTPSRKHQPRSSLPSVAVLNPFRKKASPTVERSPSPIEPYEVAPGIWNTDATAQVFGYLEANRKKAKSRGKSAGSGTRNYSQIPKRKPVAQSDSQNLIRKAPNAAGTDLLDSHPTKTPVELPSHPNVNQTKEVKRFPAQHQDQEKASKRRIGMVSRDDQLVQRGANPRTGLVSPFVVSDSSDDNVSRDYTNVGKAKSGNRPLQDGRSRSGKWKQRGAGWSLVESPSLSPIAQSVNDQVSHKVSVQQLQDKLLVQMPGVDNPQPENMTDEQIRKYQESVARAYKHGGSSAMVDPDTLPSPRQSTPEGPSTPPNKLQRIRRKMVGSGPSRKEESNDTVVVGAQKRASSVPVPRKDSIETPKVKDEIPSNTRKTSSSAKVSEDRTIKAEYPFLGQLHRRQPGQMRSVTQCPSLPTTSLQEVHSGRRNKPVSQCKEGFIDPQASPTLSQYLPRVHILHPSHFANLGTSSYRRPADLLPERLRPAEQRRQTIEDACITTITSTSNRKQQHELRPNLQRQYESTVVLKVRQHSPQKCETSKENYLQAGTLSKRPSSVTKHMVDASDSNMIKPEVIRLPRSITPTNERAGARQQLKIFPQRQQQQQQQQEVKGALSQEAEQEAEQGARAAMIENYRSRQLHQAQSGKILKAIPVNQSLSLGNANTVQDPVQGDQRNGAGIIPTYGRLGEDFKDSGCKDQEYKRRAEIGYRNECGPDPPTEIALNHDGRSWFTGQCARSTQDKTRLDSVVIEPKEALQQRRSIFGTNTDVRVPAQIHYVQQCLYQMACHVIRTLHPTSPALTMLKSPNVRAQDYLSAAKEVILAGAYLLLLLSVLLALRKVLLLVTMVLSWIWHPVGLVITILRWCVLA